MASIRPSPRHPGKKRTRSSKAAPAWQLWRAILLLVFALAVTASPLAAGIASPAAQELPPVEKARALLNLLSPQERVGQLFLVTFKGTDTGPDSPIYDLIYKYHVGGAVLQASNDNFPNGEQPLEDILALNRELQRIDWASSQESSTPGSAPASPPQFIPLLLALSQEGDGYPYDQILSGLTPLPSPMALGATWQPALARKVGEVLGREISVLGFNMLIGPSLDVLEAPHYEGSRDLGTRTFGGDPFWVGQMGQAYIEGVHAGSDGHVAVIAKHFPGFGGSDRLPEVEVATVRKSLEELERFDLVPFFDTTDPSQPNQEAIVDGLLVSHIRYQGFQGSIRLTTRPVSFDPQAFSQLMSLAPLNTWRQNGGVMVSDNLGSQAVRRYYELTSQPFDMPRRVALNAFQAGNDLLYIDDFSSGEMDSYTSAVRTLEFFAQKYREDPFFAQRVDESVLRILTLKFRLYPEFSLGVVLSAPTRLDEVGQYGHVTLEVAQQAATLISPTSAELDLTIPDPPNLNDRIVFITDSGTTQFCSTCPQQSLITTRALEDVVLRRYGPQAGGQVMQNHILSYSIRDLQTMLTAGRGETQIELDLSRAHWIVFTMLGNSSNGNSFDTLKEFLSERFDLFQQKRLIVFAFNAPYYLDATNISKLTAYYGMFSKAPQFVDVAAYILFQELRPQGSLPIPVAGVYDLNSALFPDPNQVIQVMEADAPLTTGSEATATPQTDPITRYRVGDIIEVRTGVILDHNGNPVPDDTSVEFVMSIGGEINVPIQMEVTRNGIARTTFQAYNPGMIEIRAQSELAKQSQVLRFDIQPVDLTGPPPTPTESPTPTPTSTPEPTQTPAPVPPPTQEPPRQPQFGDWIMALLVTSGLAWSSFRLMALIGQVRWGVRCGFLALIGGLAGYSYVILEMPGSEALLEDSVAMGVFLATVAGVILGLILTWLWRTIETGAREITGEINANRT